MYLFEHISIYSNILVFTDWVSKRMHLCNFNLCFLLLVWQSSLSYVKSHLCFPFSFQLLIHICCLFLCLILGLSVSRNPLVEKAMATYSSTLAWEVPWTEEPGGLQSMGSRRVGYDWATSLSLFTFMHWRRKWQPTPVFLPGESQGEEPGGPPSMGSHRVGHGWHDLAAESLGIIYKDIFLFCGLNCKWFCRSFVFSCFLWCILLSEN